MSDVEDKSTIEWTQVFEDEGTTVRRSGRDRDWVLWVISVTFGRLLLEKDYTK